METLAVVAYRQPALRAEIEAIRGVQCGEMLRQLLERDLIRISGRSSELGRPFLYGTTKRFLQVFGLRHLDELPRAADLRMREPQAPGVPVYQELIPGQDREAELPSSMVSKEESDVSIAAHPERSPLETLDEDRRLLVAGPLRAAKDEDEPDEDLEEAEDDEDEEDDDEEEDEDFDDDFDDEDWEEVDDEDDSEEEEDDEWDEDDEDDDDWEDDDDDEDEDWEEEAAE
jgi:segregation and condensation protein B